MFEVAKHFYRFAEISRSEQFRSMQILSNIVDLVKSFLNPFFKHNPQPNEYSIAKIGVDTAETEPLNVWM